MSGATTAKSPTNQGQQGGSGQQIWAQLREEGMEDVYCWAPVESKEARFFAATGFMTSDRFAIRGDADFTAILREEVSAFPLGEFNDIPDTLSLFHTWVNWPAAEARMAAKFNGGGCARPSNYEGYNLPAMYRDWLRWQQAESEMLAEIERLERGRR